MTQSGDVASTMTYTLWSCGRLLGETDLGFVYREDGVRCGWLYPTPLGERLMPVATGVAPALRTLYTMESDVSARGDVASAVDEEEALALQLRGPSDNVLPTESIWVVDTHYLLSIPQRDVSAEDSLNPEDAAEMEALLEAWDADCEPERELSSGEEAEEFPRYQIYAHLIDCDWLP